MFDKIDQFIRSLDGKIRHLVLFVYGLLDKICYKIKYIISKKSSISNSIHYNFGKIRSILYKLKKKITFYNIVIFIKLIDNKN